MITSTAPQAAHQAAAGTKPAVRSVSFQGTQLTKGQRDRLAFQQQTRAGFLNNHLQQQVDETLAALQARKEQGTPPVKPERKWFLEYQAKGTPCVAELFGF